MLFAKIFVGEPSHVDGDPSKCQAFSFDTSGPDCTKLGAQVAGYMKDNAQLTTKAQNLASKQRGTAAIACKTGMNAAQLSLAGCGFQHSLSAGGKALMTSPFLIGLKHFAWTWDPNAWPLIGCGGIITCVHARLFISVYYCESLAEEGLKALVALNTLPVFRGVDPKPLQVLSNTVLELSEGQAMFIPPGSIPVVVGAPGRSDQSISGIDSADKAVAAFIPILFDNSDPLESMRSDARLLLKQSLDQCILSQFKGQKAEVSAPLIEWMETWAA